MCCGASAHAVDRVSDRLALPRSFGFYDVAKRALGESATQRLPYHRKVAATMLGGSCAALVACPADLMLVRMQADGRLPPAQRRNYRNVAHGLWRVAREEGVRAWYRGVGPLVVRGVLVTTAQVRRGLQTRCSKLTAVWAPVFHL